jgi:cytochrome c oxidase subunit II
MNRTRREACRAMLAGISILLLNKAGLAATQPERVISIEARKFAYHPNRIMLKKGEPVILEFTAIDFTHGFNMPDLKIRADLMPGQPTRVRMVPDKAGEYAFLCDNFCGGGHEEMNGKIIVTD